MMKHLIFPAAALAAAFTLACGLAFTSCSSDDEAGQSTSRSPKKAGEIAFVTNIGTRGGSTTSDLTSFNVCTFNAGTSTKYLDNTTFTWDSNDASYRYLPTTHYWPTTGNLDFYAIVPAGGTVNSNGKSYTYSNWAGENDPVAAVAMNQSRQDKVPLTFKHILTQVSTSVTASMDNGYSLKVRSITMTVKNGGTYTFGTSTGAAGSWSSLSSSTTSLSYNYNSTTSCSTYWNIIPQSNVTFTIDYYVYKGSDAGNLLTKTSDPVNFSSEMGKKVNVNFSFSGRGIWGPDVEIKFTKTISGFGTGTSQSPNI